MSTNPPTDRKTEKAKGERRGLVIINTGHGKGKTTAALGLMMRAHGRGLKTRLFQFIKHEGAKFGEHRSLATLEIPFAGLGDGFSWRSQDLDQSKALAVAGWEEAKAAILSGDYDLVVLDEVTYPVSWGWFDVDDVVNTLKARPPKVHVVLTGRDAHEKLVETADTVTEMRKIKHAFDADEARHILKAGAAVGLGLRVHGNQLGPGPGVQLAVELGAASVDHCTYLDDADVDALAAAAEDTVATLLPGVEFCTRSPYPDAARLLAAGASIALATDCNPGTCYSSSMPFVLALAVRELGLTPGQALYAATVGGARALRRDDIGRLVVGARADLTVLDAPSHLHLGYRPGVPLARALDLPG